MLDKKNCDTWLLKSNKKYMKEKIQLNLFYYIQWQRNDQPYKMCTICTQMV